MAWVRFRVGCGGLELGLGLGGWGGLDEGKRVGSFRLRFEFGFGFWVRLRIGKTG
jgi:hypothetical protein